jgi:hypothetical protein
MDVKKILNYFDIEYVEHHPKVGHNAVGVKCPCCNHVSYYRGIFLESGINTCWACKNTMSLYAYLKLVKDIHYDEFCKVANIRTYSDNMKQTLDIIFKKKEPKKIMKTPLTINDISGVRPIEEVNHHLIDDFLIERKFTLDLLYHYGAYFGIAGDYLNYLIIPVNDSFIARDLTGTAGKKYLFPEGVNIHQQVFFTENPNCIQEPIFIVEGIFDAFAIHSVGGVAACIFGKVVHHAQLNYMMHFLTREQKIIIMLDGDVKLFEAKHFRDEMTLFFPNTVIYTCYGNDDPCSMDRNKLKQLIKE